jgi:H+/Cl- antiporter ClcA
MRIRLPEPWREAFGRELADWRVWAARILVVALAVAAGLTIVFFTWLAESASEHFAALRGRYHWAPLIVTPLCAAAVVWCTRRFAPGAAGSGIPQVMATLDRRVGEGERGLFVSLRLSVSKILLTSGGLLGGLSLGREGPSVQIAAGVMLQARRFMPAGAAVGIHGLLVAGGAAGIAAAFNTPLGGVMFAIEELARAPEQRSSGLIIAGIVLAGLVAVSAHGNGAYFGVIHAQSIGFELLGPAAGLAGRDRGRRLLAADDRLAVGQGPRPLLAPARQPARAVCGLLRPGGGGDRPGERRHDLRLRLRRHPRHGRRQGSDAGGLRAVQVPGDLADHLVGCAGGHLRALAGDRRRARQRRRAALV